MLEECVLSVSELNEYASFLLKNDPLLRNVSLKGEISGFKRHSSGHVYFSLKDANASVRCVMFRQYAYLCDVRMCDGMSVMLKGYASIYERDGQFQFYVTAVTQRGEGDLYREFIELKQKLEAKGLFDAAHKRPLPLLPKKIGVVTSRTGAVIHDITTVAERRFPGVGIELIPANVQGSGAAADVMRGIREFNERADVDVIIIGRGGGSMEDLFAFNDEKLAYVIYESAIPIVSAVGHETDYTIADFVADMRAPTPSAAAELCVPVYEELVRGVKGLRGELERIMENELERRRAKLAHIRATLMLSSPKKLAEGYKTRIRDMQSFMLLHVRNAGAAARSGYAVERARLLGLSPERTLERGYALVADAQGRYAAGVKSLQPGEKARLIMADGEADALVCAIKEKQA